MELPPVTNQQGLCAGLFGFGGDAVQGGGAGQGCLVDDDELPCLERGALHEVVLPPLRRVLRDDPQIVGEDLRGDRGRCEADDGTGAVFLLPCAAERVHGGGLACAGGADQHIKSAARDGDRREGCGLILAEHPAPWVGAAGDLLDRLQPHHRPGESVGAAKEPVFGGQQGFR